MENKNNEEISSISKEIPDLMLKNIPNEVVCIKTDSSLSTYPSIKVEKPEDFDNYSHEELIKEEYDVPEDKFIENKTSNSYIIKREPVAFDNEHFSENSNNDVKCILASSYVNLDKVSNSFTSDEWKFKTEEVDIKEEELGKSEKRMLPHCISQGKYKEQNIKKNSIRRKKPDKVFKCDHCDYRTFIKYSLKLHIRQHKNPEDSIMFKCDQCDYQTLWKQNLKKHLSRKHLLWHKSPEEMTMFKCLHCYYQTFKKPSLKKHLYFCMRKGNLK